MIDARDYDTSEELDAAMERERRTQLTEVLMSKNRSLRADIYQINTLLNYPFSDEIAKLKRRSIYYTADRIEELAKRLVLTASVIKSLCRYIPGD